MTSDFRSSMRPAKTHIRLLAQPGFWSIKQQKDATKGQKLVEFLNWALTKGETQAATLDYAPMPDSLRERVLERVKTIKY